MFSSFDFLLFLLGFLAGKMIIYFCGKLEIKKKVIKLKEVFPLFLFFLMACEVGAGTYPEPFIGSYIKMSIMKTGKEFEVKVDTNYRHFEIWKAKDLKSKNWELVVRIIGGGKYSHFVVDEGVCFFKVNPLFFGE